MAEQPSSAPADKKKPGRPKKNIQVKPTVPRGCMDAPNDADAILEFEYSNPQLLKKVINQFITCGSSEITIIFSTDNCVMHARDHSEKSETFVKINSHLLDYYYCKLHLEVRITEKNLARIVSAITRSHNNISLSMRGDYRTQMCVRLRNNDLKIDITVPIGVNAKAEDNIAVTIPNCDNYPIKFKLASKLFKEYIMGAIKTSKIFSIQKEGLQPLSLTHGTQNGQGGWTSTEDSDKIELISTIGADAVFSVSVAVPHLKPIANAMLDDRVHISADNYNRLCVSSYVDKRDGGQFVFEVNAFVEIKS